MKRLHSRAALVFLALLSIAPAAIGYNDPTVYETRTGHKYHMAGCRYLRLSKIAVKLSQAKREGLTACSVCHPPLRSGG